MRLQIADFKWRVLAIGVAVGIIAGVAYAWFLNPVRYVDIAPRQLSPADQQAYVLLVAEAYLYDHDLARAQTRLAGLGAADPAGLVAALADEGFLAGGDPDEVRALTILAEALGAHPQAAEVFSGTAGPTIAGGSPTATFEAIPSPTATEVIATLAPSTPRPSDTPTPVLIPPDSTLKLTALSTVCEDDYPAGLIEVWVLDAAGGGIPAIEILVEWVGGEDRFFTGLKPEVSPGFADFEMSPDRAYTITLVGLAEPVVGISSGACATSSGEESIPTFQLVFSPVSDQP